jgi:hypothetical protein
METACAIAGVDGFAASVHERDQAMCDHVQRRGYTLDMSTRAMGMALDEIRIPRTDIDLAPPDWDEYLRIVGVPVDFLVAPTARPTMSSSHAPTARTSRRLWR